MINIRKNIITTICFLFCLSCTQDIKTLNNAPAFSDGYASLRIIGDSIQNYLTLNANFQTEWNHAYKHKINFDCYSSTDTSFQVQLIKPNYYLLELRSPKMQGNTWMKIFLMQNETLEVNVSERLGEPFIEFGGTLADINTYLKKKAESTKEEIQAFRSTQVSIIYSDGTTSIPKTENWKDYDSLSNSAKDAELIFLENYVNQTYLPKWFYRMEKNEINYGYANSRLNYAFRKLELPADLFLNYDTLAIDNHDAQFSDSYYKFLRTYYYLQVCKLWDKRIPGYFSLTHEQKMSAQKNYAITNVDISQLKIDSLLKEHFTGSLKLAREKVSDSTMKNLAFYTAMTDLFLLPESSHPAINSFQFYSENYKQPFFDSLLSEMVKKKFNLTPGNQLPVLDFFDEKNEIITLQQLNNRVLLLSFWFPGCRPCIESIPYEKEIVEEFSEDKFTLINIGTRATRDIIFSFAKNNNIPGLILFAEYNDDLLNQFDLVSYPKFILVNKNGEVVDTSPPRPGSQELANLIKKELNN